VDLLHLLCVNVAATQSIEHFLLLCPKYVEQEQWNKPYNTISNLWFSSYSSGALDVSVGLLLGPGWDHRITRMDDEKLKFALFTSVANTRRNF